MRPPAVAPFSESTVSVTVSSRRSCSVQALAVEKPCQQQHITNKTKAQTAWVTLMWCPGQTAKITPAYFLNASCLCSCQHHYHHPSITVRPGVWELVPLSIYVAFQGTWANQMSFWCQSPDWPAPKVGQNVTCLMAVLWCVFLFPFSREPRAWPSSGASRSPRRCRGWAWWPCRPVASRR